MKVRAFEPFWSQNNEEILNSVVPCYSSVIKRSRRTVIIAGMFNLHDNAAIRSSTCTFRFSSCVSTIGKVSRDDARIALRQIDS